MDLTIKDNILISVNNLDNLKEVRIPEGVEVLDNYFLGNNLHIETLYIPSTVKEIKEHALKNGEDYSLVENIIVDDNNTTFSSYDGSLYSKDKTKLILVPSGKQGSLTIDEETIEVLEDAFEYCSNITNIEFNEGLKKVGKLSFYGCKALENITIPKCYKNNECPSFQNMKNLKEVTFPYYITEIKSGAFAWCTELKKINLSPNITTIYNAAFSYCKKLKEIILPDALERLYSAAFLGCSSLLKISIPSLVEIISPDAFEDTPKLERIDVDPNNKMYSSDENGILYNKNFTKIVRVPSNIKEVGEIKSSVTEISKQAFLGCKNLTSIVIPDNVKHIDKCAFKNCVNLTSVTLPSNLKTLNSSIFEGCKKLTKINIPSSVTFIDTEVFKDCNSLEEITLPQSVDTVNYDLFMNCTSLKKVVLSDNTDEILDRAFSGCTSLKEITIPDTIRKINLDAFKNCKALEVISVKETGNPIKEVQHQGFDTVYHDDYSMYEEYLEEEKVYKDELKCTIEQGAFKGCKKLRSITIPRSITFLKKSVFAPCTSLEEIKIQNGNDNFYIKDNSLYAVKCDRLVWEKE